MILFLDFLLAKVFESKAIPKSIVESAFNKTLADVKYHFPNLSNDEIENRIKSNSSELAIFLYRIGSELHQCNLDDLKPQIHWLLKELCGCEIYFNTIIEEGFYVVHGQGLVIGSRNRIGKGFVIHQGCTIGHKINGIGNGNVIGDNVTMYCNSSIIGELKIGDNSIIGAHVLLTKDLNVKNIVTVAINNKEKTISK